MTDPLSVTAGVVGLIGFALGSLQQTISLVQGVKGAPSAVTALAAEINTLKLILETLTSHIQNNDFGNNDHQQADFLRLLQEPLQQCVSSSQDIREKLKPYIRSDGVAKDNTWRGLSWFLHEKEFLELKRNLAAQRSALDIAVSVVNLASVNVVKKQISSLMRHLEVTDHSVQNDDFEGSSVQGTDAGYMLRRFLLETESVIDNSRPPSPLSEGVNTDQDMKSSEFSGAAPEEQLHDIPVAEHVVEDTEILSDLSHPNPVTIRTGPSALPSQPVVGKIPPDGKHKVFGVSLEELYVRDNSIVPLYVLRCISVVEEHAMKLEGVYNVSSSARFLEEFQVAIDTKGVQAGWPNIDGPTRALSIANALKLFLRLLPNQLLPTNTLQSLVDAFDKEREMYSRMYLVRAATRKASELCYATLKTIALHLREVAYHHKDNKMSSKNIALAFGPTLVAGGARDSWAKNYKNIFYYVEMTELLIEFAPEIFMDED